MPIEGEGRTQLRKIFVSPVISYKKMKVGTFVALKSNEEKKT